MSNRKKAHRSRSLSRHHDRSPSDSPPKRRKTPSPPPSSGGKSLDSIPQTLQQMQTEMTKTSERISTNHSSNNIRELSRHHILLRMTQISVLAYSDNELLDYPEDDVSLTTGAQEQAIKPNYKAIKPSHSATRPSHETNVSQTPEETQLNGQASIILCIYLVVVRPRFKKIIMGTSKGTIHVPRETVSQETHL